MEIHKEVTRVKALPRVCNYSAMVSGLFTKELGGIDGQRMHATIGIMGEVTELLKAYYCNDVANAIEEGGDAYFYFQALLNMTGVEKLQLAGQGVTTPTALYDFELGAVLYEAGEMLDLAKKSWVYGKTLDAAKFQQAMANWLYWFELFMSAEYGVTLEDLMAHNQEKLVTGEKARYKGGAYSDAAAIARADKQDAN